MEARQSSGELFKLELGTFRTTFLASLFASYGMPEKISLRDARGKLVSGSFEVRQGIITVIASDGRKMTADVAESLLNTEILARSLLLLLQNEKQRDREIIRGKS